MDEGESGFGEGADQFHRNEAISAVADDGFLAEEDDEYDDLYNDVNVGEGFFQSMKKNEDSGYGNDVVEEKKVETSGIALEHAIPGIGGGNGVAIRGVGGEGGSSAPGRVEAYDQNLGFRGNELGLKANVGSGSSIGRGGGLRVELGQGSNKIKEFEDQRGTNNVGVQGISQPQLPQHQQQQQQQQQQLQPQSHGGPIGAVAGSVGNVGNEMVRPGGGVGSVNGVGGPGVVGTAGGGSGGGGTVLFVGDLHWWTTDAELEGQLCKYGSVKEVKFFDEKASGKSKGYCQVEFYDPVAATTCKEGMDGQVFNGRPCVVAYASPYTVKRMGEAQVNRNQQTTPTNLSQAKRGNPDAVTAKPGGSNIATGGNYQGGDNNNNRGYGRGGNWGRGNAQGMGNRGPVGPMRRGGGMGGRGAMGNGGNMFGQGMGATPPLLHPQSMNMMGQGFDPAFGGPMGRMGGYGGFHGAPTPPFSGILSSFPHVGGVGLPGVAPHVNPAFFGRGGMPMNGMGMMPTAGVDGPNMGMWQDPNMGGWGGEEHGGGRVGESSYGEEAASDHQYGEVNHDRGGWPNSMKEKDRGSERDWSGSSDRRYRDDRDMPKEKDMGQDHDWSEKKNRDDRGVGRERDRDRDREREKSRDRDRDREKSRDRDRYREERDRYADHHRYKDRETEHDDEWERGRSSRTHSKARLTQEDDHRSRSRDADYGKRRRLTSE